MEGGTAMIGYCISNQYCRYKSDTGYCGYTGDCIHENAKTTTISLEPIGYQVRHEVYIAPDSIEEIAEAVVKKLRMREDK